MIQCSQTEAPPDHSRGACESDRRSNPCSSPANAKRAPVPGWVPGEPGVTGDAGPAAEAAGGISKCRCVRRNTRIQRSPAAARPFGQFALYVHTRTDIELHQRIDRPRRTLHNVAHAPLGGEEAKTH